jgi:hypothetical protein
MSGTSTTVATITATLFAPPSGQVFTFQATLDGAVYTITVTWNVYIQDWYVNCFDLNGNWIFTKKRNPSPDDFDLSFTFGYFQTSTMLYRASTNMFEISP